MAKLVLHKPEEGVDKGLELKVGFNNAWKQSLSELSGGQRSLLALSLILALLRYQPAPLYILDEIDSALDLSHTQNIGLMIKKFFQNIILRLLKSCATLSKLTKEIRGADFFCFSLLSRCFYFSFYFYVFYFLKFSL